METSQGIATEDSDRWIDKPVVLVNRKDRVSLDDLVSSVKTKRSNENRGRECEAATPSPLQTANCNRVMSNGLPHVLDSFLI
jgi:hypothetical protein